jgi:hypothetical protein
MKYSNINPAIIEERNSILGAKEFVNSICNMITTRCSDEDLTRQIMSTSLGGGNKMLTEIIETNEELGTSNFNNIVSWKWAKAQLKVNEQRDNIDLLICELVKAIVKDTLKTNETLKTIKTLDDSEKIDYELDTDCETNYLDSIDQKILENYETYLAVKSFMYAVLGAFLVNIFVVYLNIK